MKKIYIKPIIEVVEMDGDTILAASPKNNLWDVYGVYGLRGDNYEGNAHESGSLAKDFEFSFAEDFEYDL